MFCSNCGAEISEKYAFCKFCGAPQPKNQPAEEVTATPDVVPERAEYISDPQVMPDPLVQPTDIPADSKPKKSHANTIILTVVAIILVAAVAVMAIFLFGRKDNPDTDSGANQAQSDSASDSVTTSTNPSEALSVIMSTPTSTTTTTASSESSSSASADSSTSESEKVSTNAPSAVIPPTPTSAAPSKPSLSSAENMALNHVRSLFPLNPKAMSNYELLGWNNYLKIVDNSVIKATNKSSKSAAYEEISKIWGRSIHNAEDMVEASLDVIGHNDSLAERYGNNLTVTGKNFNSSYITKDQAQAYINQTIAKNKSYSKIVVDPALINWNSVDYYAKVTFDGTVSGSLKSETDLQVYILGSVNGTWKVLYSEEPEEANGKMGLMSLTFLNNFFYAG